MPSLVPRISDKTRFLDAFWRIWRCWVYLGHSRRIWFLVSRVSSLHGHAVGSGERGRKEFLNSPVYVWPVRHCSTRPNTSRLFLSFSKCLVGFRDGFSRFAMAKGLSFAFIVPLAHWFFFSLHLSYVCRFIVEERSTSVIKIRMPKKARNTFWKLEINRP